MTSPRIYVSITAEGKRGWVRNCWVTDVALLSREQCA